MTDTHDQEQLLRQLRALMGELDEASLNLLREQLEWVFVAGGDTLMSQGEPGDSMYIAISGRLRAYVVDKSGAEHSVREMGRGQVIGEMSLYTDEPRSATVIAIRDSQLVRLPKSAFRTLLTLSVPASIALTRQVIYRLQNPQSAAAPARPVAITLMPVTAGVDVEAMASALAAQWGRSSKVAIVASARVQRELAAQGLTPDVGDAAAIERRTAQLLDDIEAEHDTLLLVADAEPTEWTRRCSRRCDELLLLADATQPAALHANEREILMQRRGRCEAFETLVLLHPAGTRAPRGTRAWLDRRPVDAHLHIRPSAERDLARLARMLSGQAVGLVLAGGGARGLAHLGVWQALLDRRVEIDVVGGTSIGAVMGAMLAADQDPQVTLKIARESFKSNPTGDFNLLPLISLLAGRRLRRLVHTGLQRLLGVSEVDIEDLWKPFYCIASNYSQGRQEQLQRGPLQKAVLASCAIPGALPPVVRDGDLLCDGGTFANFPVEAMRQVHGVGQVIGVDLSYRNPRAVGADELPSPWALLFDRLRPRGLRRYRVPSLAAYLMNVTILYSTSRQAEAQRQVDVYFNPPLPRVGMLQWEKFDSIVSQGRAHAAEVLGGLAPTSLQRLQGTVSGGLAAAAGP